MDHHRRSLWTIWLFGALLGALLIPVPAGAAIMRAGACAAVGTGLRACPLTGIPDTAIGADLHARPPTQADPPIIVLANEHAYTFGQDLRFHLQAEAGAPVDSIVLSYRTSDTLDTIVVDLPVEPATTIDVEHVHQVDQRYIRPFVEISYWWTISDNAGTKLTTDPQSFEYIDDRFDWQSLSDGGIALYWYDPATPAANAPAAASVANAGNSVGAARTSSLGDKRASDANRITLRTGGDSRARPFADIRVAQQALDVAIEALSRALLDVPVEALHKTIDIYLYDNVEDLSLTLPAGLPSGADALTLYETNVILVPYGPQEANIPALRRILPHEVTHALIHEATRTDYDRVPLWLSEGLATSVEYTFVPDPDARALLDAALDRKDTLRLASLCGAFPYTGQDARLAYAQSASVVDTLRDLYGRQALRDLTAAYADGATCEGGVQRVFGMSLERLELSWRDYQAPQGRLSLFWERNSSLLILALVLSVPLLFVLPWPHWFRTPAGKDLR
jgi:hypothetical protein